MTENCKDLLENFIQWGISSDKLSAALLLGSQAREDKKADEYSDIDIVLIVDEPDYFISSDEWLHEIGEFHVSFIEDTLDGLKERRVLFDNALDADFILRPKDTVEKIVSDEVAAILSDGYKLLIDKIGLQDIIKSLLFTKQSPITRQSKII